MSAPAIRHAFTSAKSDGADTTLVRPSDWNADHSDGWTTVNKTADEDVASSTTMQNDDHLFFTAASGTPYEIEWVLIYSSPAGGGTPDIKVDVGEDTTPRGVSHITGNITLTDTGSVTGGALHDQTNTMTAGTSTLKRVLRARAWHVGNGGTFRIRWAQNTSDANPTRVHSGSYLRYRAIT